MIVYWTLCICMILVQFVPFKNRDWNILTALLLLFFYGAFREDFGLDYAQYYDYYNLVQITNYNPQERIETGYHLLNRFIPTWRMFVSITSLFTCVTLFYFIKNCIPRRYYALFFLMFTFAGDSVIFFQFSGLRNAIAINIFLLTVVYIIKHRPKWWIILYLSTLGIAYNFHTSSIMFYGVALPFMFNWQAKGLKSIILLLLIFVVLYLISSNILYGYMKNVVDLYFDKYNSYLIEDGMDHRPSFMMIAFIFIYTLFAIKSLNSFTQYSLEASIIRLSLCYIIALSLGPLSGRLIQVFALLLISGPVVALRSQLQRPIKYTYIVIVLIFLAYSFIHIYLNNPYFTYQIYTPNFNLI